MGSKDFVEHASIVAVRHPDTDGAPGGYWTDADLP